MPRKAVLHPALISALPPHSSSRWLFAFEVAARMKIDAKRLHPLLRRAFKVKGDVDRRLDVSTGRFQYARAKQ